MRESGAAATNERGGEGHTILFRSFTSRFSMIQQQLKSSIASSAKKHPAGSFIVRMGESVVRKQDLFAEGNGKSGSDEKRQGVKSEGVF